MQSLPNSIRAGSFRGSTGAIVAFMVLLFLQNCAALTRWSCVQFVPDADLLGSGAVVFSAQAYYYSDVDKGTTVIPGGFVNVGIIEWVNLEAGYAGGPALGLKAKILGESRPWMPSLAIGARNIFTHREAYLYNRTVDSLGSEFYMVLGKSIESVRLRMHVGVQSLPESDNEKACPFFALEKYFGMGLYLSIEGFYREKTMHPSIFAAWRFLGKKAEISAGIIDVTGMFVDRGDVPPNSPFYESNTTNFVRPGIWVGLRFNGGIKIGKSGGFTGIENSLNDHSSSITTLRSEVDSLKMLLRRSSTSIETLNKTLLQITDSSKGDEQRYTLLVSEKISLINSLYGAEPFDPDAVNNAMAQLVSGHDQTLSALYGIIVDPVQEGRIRALAVSVLGEIGSAAAADIVIGLLGQSTVPEITIECLIALGKMRDTRAVYLMQQLSNDPNDDVAFTAAEMLQKLEKETGVSTAALPAAKPSPVSIPEKTIGAAGSAATVRSTTVAAASPPVPSVPTPAATQNSSEAGGSMKIIDKPEFQEATVAAELNDDLPTLEEGADSRAAVVSPVPEATLTPEQKPVPESRPVEIVSPLPEKVNEIAPVDTKENREAKTGAKKAETKKSDKREKKTAKRKNIDTSSDTW